MGRKYVCSDCQSTTERIMCSKCGKYISEEDILISDLIDEPDEVKGDDFPATRVGNIIFLSFFIIVTVVFAGIFVIMMG